MKKERSWLLVIGIVVAAAVLLLLAADAFSETETYSDIPVLAVPQMYQDVGEWADEVIGYCDSSYTMATHGCAVTSYAMVAQYFNGELPVEGLDPGVFESCLETHGCFDVSDGGCQLLWPCAVQHCGLGVGMMSWDRNYNNPAEGFVDSLLREGYPLAVRVRSENHFVVLIGKQGGQYRINDPKSSLGRTHIPPSKVESIRLIYGTSQTLRQRSAVGINPPSPIVARSDDLIFEIELHNGFPNSVCPTWYFRGTKPSGESWEPHTNGCEHTFAPGQDVLGRFHNQEQWSEECTETGWWELTEVSYQLPGEPIQRRLSRFTDGDLASQELTFCVLAPGSSGDSAQADMGVLDDCPAGVIPPPPPTPTPPVSLVQCGNLSISPSNAQTGEPVNFSFPVCNESGQSVNLTNIGPQGSAPNGGLWNSFRQNLTVPAGGSANVSTSRSFEWGGTWCTGKVTYETNGYWYDLDPHGYTQAQCFNIQGESPAPNDGITLYRDTGYGGVKQLFTADQGHLNITTIGDDQASSLQVRGPYFATLYQDPYYGGISESFYRSDGDLRDNEIGSDAVSSLRVYPAVALYTDSDYGGKCETFVTDDGYLDDNYIGSDQVSSLKIPSGYVATLYRDPNYQGLSKIFTADDSNLTNDELNDTVSSIKIQRLVPDGVTLFEHSHHIGNNWAYLASIPYLPSGVDDQADSVAIRGPFLAIVYTDPDYGGQTEVFDHDDLNLGDNIIGGNHISSIGIQPAAALYEQGGYGGRCQTFTGSNGNLEGSYIGNDQASSLKVPQGYRVTLCRDPNFTGSCMTFTADVTNLGNVFEGGNDSVSSIRVELNLPEPTATPMPTATSTPTTTPTSTPVSSGPPDVSVSSVALAPEVPSGENPIAKDGTICWGAPRLPKGSARPDICTRWDDISTPTVFYFFWTEEQIGLSNLSGEGVAIWTGGLEMKVTYSDGETCTGGSFLISSGLFQVEVSPTEADNFLAQGEIRGGMPQCTHLPDPPNTETAELTFMVGGSLPVDLVVKVDGNIGWQGKINQSQITIPLRLPSKPWILIGTKATNAHGQTIEEQGWLWTGSPYRIYLPIVIKGSGQ